jgi:hypothetical protein
MMTMIQPQIAPSLFGTIKTAVACDDIHQACQIVQKLLGVCHGGLSGIHFPELGDATCTPRRAVVQDERERSF